MAVIDDDTIVKKAYLLPGDVVSIVLSLITLPMVALFFWQRLKDDRSKNMTVASFSCLLTYFATFLFIFTVTTMLHIRAKHSAGLCDATVLLCLTLHSLAKSSEFLFLIERAYVISWPITARHRTPEYVLSCIGIFIPYAVVTAAAIKFRIADSNTTEICIIGIQLPALLSLLSVEVIAQLYLTLRFLYPLIHIHRDGTGLLLPLRKMVIRTIIGSSITLLSNLTVRTSLTLFNGEPAWLCCLTCKADAFIAAVALHWITKPIKWGGERQPQLGVGFETTPPEGNSRVEEMSSREISLKDMLTAYDFVVLEKDAAAAPR